MPLRCCCSPTIHQTGSSYPFWAELGSLGGRVGERGGIFGQSGDRNLTLTATASQSLNRELANQPATSVHNFLSAVLFPSDTYTSTQPSPVQFSPRLDARSTLPSRFCPLQTTYLEFPLHHHNVCRQGIHLLRCLGAQHQEGPIHRRSRQSLQRIELRRRAPVRSLLCTCPPRKCHLGIRILILVMAKSPAFTCVGSMVTATVANMYTEVVRRFFLMSEARTQQKPSRTSVTPMKPARSSMGCSLET